MHLEYGSVVDRYTIENRIGQGGMAVVYKARHNQLGTTHAIKVLLMPSQAVRSRLLTEGRVQATLRHPNIVTVTDVIDVAGSPGLVMELVHGPSLDQLLRQVKLNFEQADELARGILAGVAQAHRHGLIHRDLKPANVMLQATETGFVPKVTDFGLAKILDTEEGVVGTQTRSNVAMGTPCYMAPEQVRNAKGVDKRADIFSLGALLYELLAGERAFGGSDLFEIFQSITSGKYTPLRELVPDVPERMAQAVESALQTDRELRAQDCEALLAIWTGQSPISERSGPWSAEMLAKVRSPTSHAGAAPSSGTWAGDENGPSSESIEPPASLGRPTIAPGGAPEALGLSGVLAAAANAESQPIPRRRPGSAGSEVFGGGESGRAGRQFPIPTGIMVLGGALIAALVVGAIVWGSADHTGTVAPEPGAKAVESATVSSNAGSSEPAAGAAPATQTPASPVPSGEPLEVDAPVEPGPPAPAAPMALIPAPVATAEKPSVKPATKTVTSTVQPASQPFVATGTLLLNSRPWSDITLDGAAAGRTGNWKRELSAGRHSVTLASSDGRATTKSVSVEASAQTPFCWDFDLDANCPK